MLSLTSILETAAPRLLDLDCIERPPSEAAPQSERDYPTQSEACSKLQIHRAAGLCEAGRTENRDCFDGLFDEGHST